MSPAILSEPTLLLTVSSDTTTICAGAVASSPHQATITATLTDCFGNPISGTTITFATIDSNPTYPSSLSSTTATTQSDGTAVVILTSGQKVNSTTTVTATCAGLPTGAPTPATAPITMAAPTPVWTIDPEMLDADGVSTATITLSLQFGEQPVDGHDITWRINDIWDSSDTTDSNLVYSADPPFGAMDGYGTLTLGNQTGGIYTAIYQVGTSSGVIEFEALDNSVVANSPLIYTKKDKLIKGIFYINQIPPPLITGTAGILVGDFDQSTIL